MATKKKTKKEKKPEFRSLLGEGNQFEPLKETFNGFEIEKRWVIMTHEDDYSKGKNGIMIYNEALLGGERYEQGYVTEMEVAIQMVGELGIVPDFKPNTIRLRKIGAKTFILTLKDKKETKRREVEWALDKKVFLKLWPLTKGHRIYKTRFHKKIKGHEVVIDAFTDRFLLMAEIEVKHEDELKDLPKLGFDVTTDSAWTNKTMSK